MLGFTFDDKRQSETATSVPERPPSSKKRSKKKSKQEAIELEEDSGATEGAVGSVAGGGRYDNLVSLFTPNSVKVPCVGVSFGVERLLAISEMLARRRAVTGDTSDPATIRATETEVMVIVAHKGLIAPRLQLAQELWDAKIKVGSISSEFTRVCVALLLLWKIGSQQGYWLHLVLILLSAMCSRTVV